MKLQTKFSLVLLLSVSLVGVVSAMDGESSGAVDGSAVRERSALEVNQAELGAAKAWRDSLRDEAAALEAYRVHIAVTKAAEAKVQELGAAKAAAAAGNAGSKSAQPGFFAKHWDLAKQYPYRAGAGALAVVGAGYLGREHIASGARLVGSKVGICKSASK